MAVKVKMLKRTSYNYQMREKGSIQEVDEETARRWHKNKIASLRSKDAKKLGILIEEEDNNGVPSSNDSGSGGVSVDTGKRPSSGSGKASEKKPDSDKLPDTKQGEGS